MLDAIVHILAAPTQEDVFRSIQDNVGGEFESGKFLLVLLCAVGLIALLVLVSRRKSETGAASRTLNHQGKLMKEVLRMLPLRGREVKQLRIVAAQVEVDGAPPSPLTLLLCPSVLARTVQSKRLKVDPKALASVARKAGLQVTSQKC